MGKRKERDEEAEPGPSTTPQTHGSTLFVSNLPYTATSVDLQTLFSDIAPVRSAFVVLDKESRKSKGVGYVSFALREDAATSVAQIESDGITLDGRSLRVQFADSKSHHAEESAPAAKSKKPKQPPRRAPKASTAAPAPTDPLAIRTVVISNLPASSIDAKSLWKKVRKHPGAEKVAQWPAKAATGGGGDGEAEEDPTVAHVLFETPAAAQTAATRLHAHVFKGALLSAVLKKRLDAHGAPTRASRLIVRNLPWSATEDDLRRLFLPHGPIHSITVPTMPSEREGGAPRAKGFAFVWMMNRADAERAIEGANGATVGGEKGRVVAVDWALSKERWEEERQKAEEAEESDGADGADEGSGGSNDEMDRADDDSEESDEEGKEEDNDTEPPDRPQLPPPEAGTTLFIRNVPFDATEDELRTLFRAFGPMRYARITMDASTGRSRGTGFVCFWDKADADRVIQQAEVVRTETGTAQAKKNPFSLLTPDPSSSLAQSLVLHGRTLDITRAVTREEAGRLRELGQKQREKQDKRNLYLMREGVIFPDTAAASTLPPAEVERRVQAFNTRRALLKSNPSLYISKTRLSVRQLPGFVTERTLKRLAIHSVRAFEEEVKSGARDPLGPEEEAAAAGGDTAGEDGGAPKTRRRRRVGERPTPVRQAKIVRQEDRVDPLTGKGRSKGYGFLELNTHADALRVLRWANNSPGALRLMRGWWIEELRDLAQKLGDAGKKAEGEEEGGGQARARRIKERLQQELERTEGAAEENGEKEKEGRRTLLLEFSVENIQVVKRRRERETGHQKPESKAPKRKESDAAGEERRQSRPVKRRRLEAPGVDGEDTSKAPLLGTKVGGIIGRKRKERKNAKVRR